MKKYIAILSVIVIVFTLMYSPKAHAEGAIDADGQIIVNNILGNANVHLTLLDTRVLVRVDGFGNHRLEIFVSTINPQTGLEENRTLVDLI